MEKEYKKISMESYDYPLPDERIAKFPLPQRDTSKLLLYKGGVISEDKFNALPSHLPENSLLIFNNTRVIHNVFFNVKFNNVISVVSCND